jgi:hypothetical protein
MNASRFFGAVLAAGLGVSVVASGAEVRAQGGKGKSKTTQPAPQADPPLTSRAVALSPKGLAWGMTSKQLFEAYDHVIDEDHRAEYKTASPGVQMKRIDAQIAEEKSQIRRSRIDFGALPTTVDATPLKGEYTYNNKESLLTVDRKGATRHLFLIQDRLWKIIDEHHLSDASPYGKDFQAAMVKLSALFGVPGRIQPPDPAKGQFVTVVDWKDSRSHLRAIERGDTQFALVYEDLDTLSRLASLRPNQEVTESLVDPAVADIVRKDDAPAAPPAKGSAPKTRKGK